MNSRCEIVCVDKIPHHTYPHEHILNIGYVDMGGVKRVITIQQAIDGIKTGRLSFHVKIKDHYVNVFIQKSENGNEYLRTEADGILVNNLLQLPKCQL
ncbi:MAG: DUF3892 domain-containing protein [Gammaproteobacteria bacterium]|nr:DUF3892 domain-containing protein [Gammaproteobacteria bacterium]